MLEDVFLSVVVITKNEETDLPGFLRNFSAIADEIVIFDDGSTDRTAEIAANYGAPVRFIKATRSSGEGFCDQRNKGLRPLVVNGCCRSIATCA